ncbi:unnamed protein product, partial [Closterium sp. NIES-53]
RQPSVQESLSPQQLREWAIWWGSPSVGASRASRRKPLSPQKRREWAVRWGATTGGTCESTPAGSAASRRGGSGGGQQQQQRPLETLSPQQLCEWAVRRGSPGGGGFRGTHTGGVEAPGGVEATSLGACDSASAGAEPEEALHTFTLDSGASCCLHLVSFAKNLVATSVLQDQWVIVTQPGGEVVAICTNSRTGEHLATFTRRPGSGLYTLTTESALVAESDQVAASVEVAAFCSCGLLMHQTLLWHHRLGHPSLPRLRSMHSHLLVSGLPKSLPPLPRSLALPCLPCVEGRQRVAPHSSSFPPTTAPLQTLHMDVWDPTRVTRQGGDRYFLLVDLLVLRLHSDRGGEFFSHLFEDFCGAEGIVQSYTLPASPQQNEIAERRIGLVMEVACTSMIHAAAPHFLWPFAVRYAAEQLNLWPHVSHPETSPTLRWTGEVGDASAFRVQGSLSLVRVLPAGKLSPRTLRCVFLDFPTDAPPCSPPASLPGGRPPPPPSIAPLPPPGPAPLGVSQVDPPPLVEPLEVSSDTSGPAEGGDQTATDTMVPRRSARLAVPPGFQPRPSSPPLRPVDVDSSAAGGGDTGGADSGGAGSGGAASPERLREWAVCWGSTGGGTWRARAAVSGGADHGGASAGVPGVGSAGGTGAGGTGATGGTGGAAAGGPGSRCQEPLLPERLCEWAVRTGGAGAAGGTGGAGPGGASAGVPRVGRAGGTGTGGGADTGGTRVSGASRQESLSPLQLREWAVYWGSPGGGARGTGSGGAVATGAGGYGGATTQPQPSVLRHLLCLRPAATEFPVVGTTPPLLFPPTDQSKPQLLPGSPLPAPAPHTEVTASLTARHEPKTRASTPHRREPENRASDPTRVRLAELVDYAALCRLEYTASVVFYFSCPPSVGGELALGCDVLGDMHFELECLATTAPHLVSTLLFPEGDPDALDIPTPRTYAEAITGTYVNEVPRPVANIVDGMWILRVKRPPGSPPTFKVRYVARGFSQREGFDFFHTFSPTPKMTTLRVLLHVVAQRDYELHSLDFLTAFLQGSLHEAIWLRRPRGFTGSFPEGTQWSLRRPVYGLRQAPCEWHDTLRTTLAALGFAPLTADPLLFLRTDTSLPPFYVLVYVVDLVFATADTEALALVKAELQERHTCTDVGPSTLRLHIGLATAHSFVYRPLTLSSTFGRVPRYVAPGRHRKVHWEATKRAFHYLCSTLGMGLVRGGPGSVVLTGHSNASWADDQTTHQTTQGYRFSLGTGSVSWRSTRSSSVLSSSCEAEIYAGAMAALELRWLTYLLTDLGERPCSPPLLYVDNKAMIASCHGQRLEHRTKHIALRYFLTQKLQQRGQLRLAYVVTQANSADVFTKALSSSDL